MRTLASSMNARDVIIFTQPDCAYCEMAKRWLDEHGFAYTECDIGSDPDCAAAYKRYLAVGTPYVVIRRNGRERHLRNGFTAAAFLAALT
ncbi:glutaredoxin family protein [Pseudoduganella sp. GCM10020061]|uniref:glutaredoxin family protein n=1 Tax=Pseudoduganella sp. GCM10020061 TaxID=3317345 RepID=UPI0036291851